MHYKVFFSQRFDVRYWMSVGVKKGFHLRGEQLYLSSDYIAELKQKIPNSRRWKCSSFIELQSDTSKLKIC
ncbi:hypothetical protein E2C01_054148 [Portunus trituberculatus]|uniref:Uncharacterized protein n=1 Tax=Portunus trituberculatus TaxID=210409 RepID=A0A5B7GJ39_PORTR|nr:hypothetical protein [Portunus trituberculatus]